MCRHINAIISKFSNLMEYNSDFEEFVGDYYPQIYRRYYIFDDVEDINFDIEDDILLIFKAYGISSWNGDHEEEDLDRPRPDVNIGKLARFTVERIDYGVDGIITIKDNGLIVRETINTVVLKYTNNHKDCYKNIPKKYIKII